MGRIKEFGGENGKNGGILRKKFGKFGKNSRILGDILGFSENWGIWGGTMGKMEEFSGKKNGDFWEFWGKLRHFGEICREFEGKIGGILGGVEEFCGN